MRRRSRYRKGRYHFVVKDEYWYSFPSYCMNTFDRKLYRVALDAGMSCPNRDGTIGTGGCIFCDEGGSGDFAIAYHGQKLVEEDLIYNHSHSGNGSYIAYFQAYTNTYAPCDRLRMLYTSALDNPLFAGISIATRPDCLGDDVMALLKELNNSYPDKFIWVELGLQSKHDRTAVWMHRGYPLTVFDEACEKLKDAGILIIVHIILGLYQESDEMVLDTIRHLNEMHIDGIKIQLLHYLAGTKLYEKYVSGNEAPVPMEEEHYVELVVQCLGMLDENIVVHRLTGDGDRKLLKAPLWSLHKRKVLNEIRHEMAVHHIRQGSLRKKVE